MTSARNMVCHCGNVTTIGKPIYRSSPLMLDGCCLVCRCDEHEPAAHLRRTTHDSDWRPGCGPLCRHRPQKEQAALVSRLMSRDIPPDLAEWYRRLASMEFPRV